MIMHSMTFNQWYFIDKKTGNRLTFYFSKYSTEKSRIPLKCSEPPLIVSKIFTKVTN